MSEDAAPARLFATPAGVKLCTLETVVDGGARNFVLQIGEARFGLVFARRGLNPEAASSWFLPRLVGVQTALEWCYTGRVFPAQEAFDRGLVRSLHAPDELLPAAKRYAKGHETVYGLVSGMGVLALSLVLFKW